MFRVIDSKSPAVSPRVVAQIFMTQKAKVICGSLFIVCRSGFKCGDGAEQSLKNRFMAYEKSVHYRLQAYFRP
jgi:hypothetical protein